MANLFDYLLWRGDLALVQSSFQDVDSLLLSTVSYVFLDGIVSERMDTFLTLQQAAERFFENPQEQQRSRVPEDITLLREMAKCRRYAEIRLCGYVNKLDFAQEKQFCAMTMLLEDGTAFIAYRGTDRSLIGWKEDFNMSFMDAVPAQIEAEQYLLQVAKALRGMPMRIGGHSKGGNLAVYAAAMMPERIQANILAVYNHDGLGFREGMLQRSGYRRILSKVKTFLPQSSVIGMLLEHEEAYTVIQSREIGFLQHDPYSWEVQGRYFVKLEHLSEKSRFLDKTLKRWLAEVGEHQRECFVDAVYDALVAAKVDKQGVTPRILFDAIQALKEEDDATKSVMGNSVKMLLQAAKETVAEYAGLSKYDRKERGRENEK